MKENFPDFILDDATVDAFVKNAHHLKLLRGRRYGEWDDQRSEIGQHIAATCYYDNHILFLTASALETIDKPVVTHLAISALFKLFGRGDGTYLMRSPDGHIVASHRATDPSSITAEALRTEIEALIGQGAAPLSNEVEQAIENAAGEL